MNQRVLVTIFKAIVTVLVSAFIGSAGLFLGIVSVNGPPPPGQAIAGLFQFLFLGTLVSAPFVAAGMVVIGIPADIALSRSGVRHPAAYAASGGGGGLFIAALFGIAFGAADEPWFLTPVCAGYGLVTASVYWFLFPRMRAAAA